VNAPGQTASNWALTQSNIGYVAENSENKVTSISNLSTDIEYPTAKLLYDQLALKEPTITGTGNTTDFWSGAKTFRNLASDVRAVTLTGLSLVTNQVISATDTIIQAFGYLQKQVTDILTTLTSHVGNTSNPHAVTKAQVGLANVQDIKVNYAAVTDPAVSNDNTQGYAAGSSWINTVTGREFVCVNAATGAANWREITNPAPSVFGNDYQLKVYSVPVGTGSTTFIPNNTAPNQPVTDQILVTTGLTGTHRIEWSCLVTNNKKQGEFRLVDYTNPASPAQVGLSVLYEATNTADQVRIGNTAYVSPGGANKNYIIQFRATGAGSTETVVESKMEIFRVS
jgi:hypothetical protein